MNKREEFSTQMTQIRRIFADKKKICGHLLKSVLSACLLSESGFTGFQDSQDKMKQINQHLAMSRRGLNMYNPLQAKRSWGYKITTTLLELRSSSIYRHADNADLKRFSQIRKKSAVICINLRHLRAFCLLPTYYHLKLVQTYV